MMIIPKRETKKKKEALLLFEWAGRQMGMPSPHGDISTNYKF